MSTWLCEHPGASIADVRDSAPKDCFQFCSCVHCLCLTILQGILPRVEIALCARILQ